MQQSKALLLLLVVGLSATLGQISIPLNRYTVQQQGVQYISDVVYTFDLNIHEPNEPNLKTIIDLQDLASFVIEQGCTNCFTTQATSQDSYVCDNTCGTAAAPNGGSYHFVGEKISAVLVKNDNIQAIFANYEITLNNVNIVSQLKDSNSVDISKLYLDNVKAGLGFAPQNAKNTQSPIYNIFEKLQAQYPSQNIDRQFSLFFNQDMGRLLIGQPEKFFQDGDLNTFKVIEDEEGNTNWGIVAGPYITVPGLKDISTVDSIAPDTTSTSNLNTVYFDSTTKYLEFPQAVFKRLNNALFNNYSCVTQNGVSTCDCPNNSVNFLPITITFVNNPSKSTIVDNSVKYTIQPNQYLEEIGNGKCLLLIKQAQNEVSSDFKFGTSFLSNYYSMYNFDKYTIQLAPSHGFVPAELALNDNYRLPFIIAGAILALLLVGILFLLLKQLQKPTTDYIPDAIKPHSTTTISYYVKSPRAIESISQIVQSAKSVAPIGTPIRARVINSGYTVGYPQQTYQSQY